MSRTNVTIVSDVKPDAETTASMDAHLPQRHRAMPEVNKVDVKTWLMGLNRDWMGGGECLVIIDSAFFTGIVNNAGIKINFSELVSGIPGAGIAQYFTPAPLAHAKGLSIFIHHLTLQSNIKVNQRKLHFGQYESKLGSMVTDILLCLNDKVFAPIPGQPIPKNICIFSREVDIEPVLAYLQRFKKRMPEINVTIFSSKYYNMHASTLSKADFVVSTEDLLSELGCYHSVSPRNTENENCE